MTSHVTTPIRILAGALLAGAATLAAATAGDLDPPAAPAPTMKTMDEVEPRVPIRAADLPLVISASGSYYLAEDITTAGGGITIGANTEDVTIDLAGHALRGGTGSGILCGNPSGNVVIRNGVVAGWADAGIDCPITENMLLADLLVADNTSNGMEAGRGSVVVRSVAEGNGGDGFVLGNESIIRDSVARTNGDDGIRVNRSSAVIGNVCDGNGTTSANGAGIELDNVNSISNRIEGNHLVGNDYGIRILSTGNLVIKNSARGNSTGDYSIAAGNTVGPILGVADPITSTNPWANFSF